MSLGLLNVLLFFSLPKPQMLLIFLRKWVIHKGLFFSPSTDDSNDFPGAERKKD